MYYGYGMAPGYNGYGCNTGCYTQQQSGGRGYGYALILVLFILLVIIGASRI